MSKKIIFISIFLILVITSILLFKISNKPNNEVEKENKIIKSNKFFKSKNNKKIDYNKIINELNKEINIEQREIFNRTYEDKVEFYIGNNKRELENGYYDILFECIKDKEFNIYINKLWKETKSDELYEDIYVTEIVKLINQVFEFDLSKLEEAKLKEIIIKNYLLSKESLLKDEKKEYVNLQINDVNYIFSLDKGRLKLKIEYIKY